MKLPVAATHGVVGAIIGSHAVVMGFNGINWETLGYIGETNQHVMLTLVSLYIYSAKSKGVFVYRRIQIRRLSQILDVTPDTTRKKGEYR